MASNSLVLRENGVTLEFTTMNGSAVVKQADVIMVTYPLSYTTNYSSQDALNDLDYVSLYFFIRLCRVVADQLYSMLTSNLLTDLP